MLIDEKKGRSNNTLLLFGNHEIMIDNDNVVSVVALLQVNCSPVSIAFSLLFVDDLLLFDKFSKAR